MLSLDVKLPLVDLKVRIELAHALTVSVPQIELPPCPACGRRLRAYRALRIYRSAGVAAKHVGPPPRTLSPNSSVVVKYIDFDNPRTAMVFADMMGTTSGVCGDNERHPALARFPVVRALASLAPALNSTGLSWGPTGSVGFALATGLLVLRQDSDLDLLVRAPSRLAAELCAMLMMLTKQAGCRVDIQVDTGSGGFALAEWARSGQRVLLKTNHGPILTDDPWGGGVPRSVKP